MHRNSTETVTKYLREAGDKGITILPPCVNASAYGFRPEGQQAIRFGLCAVKRGRRRRFDPFVRRAKRR